VGPLAAPGLKQDAAQDAAHPARVILYNDDWHTFEDVILQLMKAIKCGPEEGERHAWIVHTEGRSMVYEGPRGECERVAGILREIRLQVEVDWD
jgi:ATP-dependent Clp protease adaptor protein ClpS